MDKSLRNTLINSTLAFVSAFIMTTVIHEFGHYLSYVLSGANPALFHNYVQTSQPPLSIHARVVSAFAGPFISLFQGIIFAIIVSRGQKNTAGHLFFLWLSLLGYVNFFGYLVMTPFSTTGDTGKVAQLLNIGYTSRILIAVAGFALLIWVILKTAKNFSNFIAAEHDLKKRSRIVYCLMFFPIMIGSMVNTIFAFPVVALLSVIYPATSAYVIMISFGVILNSVNPRASRPEFEGKIMKSLVLLTLGAILLNRFLTFGVG